MTEQLTPEYTVRFSPETEQVVDAIIQEVREAYEVDLPETLNIHADRYYRERRESDKQIQQEIEDTGFIDFSYSRKIAPYLYKAILSGFDPTEEELAAAEKQGDNFIEDEIYHNFHTDHPEFSDLLHEFGYGSERAPIPVPYSGALMIPESVLRGILSGLHERGKDYRLADFGFPNWSGVIE